MFLERPDFAGKLVPAITRAKFLHVRVLVVQDQGRKTKVVSAHDGRVQRRKVQSYNRALVITRHRRQHRRALVLRVGIPPNVLKVHHIPAQERVSSDQVKRFNLLTAAENVVEKRVRHLRHLDGVRQHVQAVQQVNHQVAVHAAVVDDLGTMSCRPVVHPEQFAVVIVSRRIKCRLNMTVQQIPHARPERLSFRLDF